MRTYQSVLRGREGCPFFSDQASSQGWQVVGTVLWWLGHHRTEHALPWKPRACRWMFEVAVWFGRRVRNPNVQTNSCFALQHHAARGVGVSHVTGSCLRWVVVAAPKVSSCLFCESCRRQDVLPQLIEWMTAVTNQLNAFTVTFKML